MLIVSCVLLVVLTTLQGCQAVDSLKFLAVGDWGGLPDWPYVTAVEQAVANQMAAVADLYNPSFTLALGDNFYYDGVTHVHDPRFQSTFEDVFHHESLMMPWYVIAGNHDHHGNVTAQIAYTDLSERWNFPNNFYALTFAIPGGNKRLDILMIDTVLLCGNTNSKITGDQPNGPAHPKNAIDQWQWIEWRLRMSSADYVVIAGHYPVYSIAEHGPTRCLTEKLKPMLHKYKVTAYLCGHDHNLQHIRSKEARVTVDYVVSGAGNFVNPSNKHRDSIPEGTLQFFWASKVDLGGFAYIEATNDNMTMVFVDGLQRPVYQFTTTPRK